MQNVKRKVQNVATQNKKQQKTVALIVVIFYVIDLGFLLFP